MFIFVFVAVAAFLGSMGAKLLADHFLTVRIPIIGSFAGLVHSVNPGISFGITLPFQDFLVPLALLLVLILAWQSARSTLSHIAFGLIAGGAIANIADRFRDGVVTDFFQVGAFPIFNVADSCITIGVGLLLVEVMRER